MRQIVKTFTGYVTVKFENIKADDEDRLRENLSESIEAAIRGGYLTVEDIDVTVENTEPYEREWDD